MCSPNVPGARRSARAASARAVTNFGLGEIGTVAAFTAVSMPVGFATGTHARPHALSSLPPGLTRTRRHAAAHPLMRNRSVAAAATIGALAGFMYAYQSSAGRLMGAFPNSAEVEAAKSRR